MCADEQDVRVVIEHIVCAVAMVHLHATTAVMTGLQAVVRNAC